MMTPSETKWSWVLFCVILGSVFHTHSETFVLGMAREDLSILAVIGEGMKNYAGISGRFFNALGQSKVNIVAWAFRILDAAMCQHTVLGVGVDMHIYIYIYRQYLFADVEIWKEIMRNGFLTTSSNHGMNCFCFQLKASTVIWGHFLGIWFPKCQKQG